MTGLSVLALVCGSVLTIVNALLLFVRPLRLWFLGIAQIIDGQRCLLRSDMLRAYFKHRETKQIRQYEIQNFLLAYDAYKALGGNQFIDHIHEEVSKWEVIT